MDKSIEQEIKVKEDFLGIIKNHEMTILNDNKYCRVIRFRNKNGDSNGHFTLVTWPNHLTISGDYGTYTFRRLEDMFEFFRREELTINSGYWAEKCESESIPEKMEVFDNEYFVECVRNRINEYYDGEIPEDDKEDLDNLIESFVDREEHECYNLLFEDVEYSDIFCDFLYDNTFKCYTFYFLWCLYAIVWGIKRYDEYKKGEKYAKDFLSKNKENIK